MRLLIENLFISLNIICEEKREYFAKYRNFANEAYYSVRRNEQKVETSERNRFNHKLLARLNFVAIYSIIFNVI